MACTATSNLEVVALKFDADDSDETSSYRVSSRSFFEFHCSCDVRPVFNLLGCSRY